MNYANFIFTAIFALEMVIKIIAMGLIVGRNTYLRSGWNIMDGLLVIIAITDIVIMHFRSLTSNDELNMGSPTISMLKIFRLLRALRPLRG